jgi:hypothetical protein
MGSLFMIGFYNLITRILTVFPNADTGVQIFLNDSIQPIINNFYILADYYLPVSYMLSAIAIYVSVWLAIFVLKLTTKVIAILSLGTIKVDKLTEWR